MYCLCLKWTINAKSLQNNLLVIKHVLGCHLIRTDRREIQSVHGKVATYRAL